MAAGVDVAVAAAKRAEPAAAFVAQRTERNREHELVAQLRVDRSSSPPLKVTTSAIRVVVLVDVFRARGDERDDDRYVDLGTRAGSRQRAHGISSAPASWPRSR